MNYSIDPAKQPGHQQRYRLVFFCTRQRNPAAGTYGSMIDRHLRHEWSSGRFLVDLINLWHFNIIFMDGCLIFFIRNR